ncbi:hypothetical protein BG000_003920, partial [Podila horticola]
MSDSLALDEIEKDTPYLTFTDKMPSLSLSDVDSRLPAHPGFSSLRSGHSHGSLLESVFVDDGSFRHLFDVSSSDEASYDSGCQTSFQGSDPLWRFCEEEGSDEDGGFNEDSDYYPVWCSDEESDSELNEPKGAQTSGLSTEDEDGAIFELATKVLDCARNGMQTGVTEQCVAVMSK